MKMKKKKIYSIFGVTVKQFDWDNFEGMDNFHTVPFSQKNMPLLYGGAIDIVWEGIE